MVQATTEQADTPRQKGNQMSGYPVILNGDHAEFEREWAGKDPKTRPDWPMPSFNAMDWAEAFCKVAASFDYRDRDGKLIEADWMVAWFAGALMRGYDEHAAKQT
jgi:hypothetical protein